MSDVFDFLYSLSDIVKDVTLIVEIIAIAFFIVQFFKRNKLFLSAYFYVSTINLSIHAIAQVSSYIADKYWDDLTVTDIDDVVQSYSLLIIGPLNVLLNFNRFTALVFIKNYKRMWIFRRTVIYGIVVLAIPAALYTISKHIDCNSEDPCYNFDLRIKFQMFTLLICGVICVILIIGSIIATRFNPAFHGSSTASKIERRLLLQCSVSTLFFTFTIIFVGLYTHFLLFSRPTKKVAMYMDLTGNIYIIGIEIVYGTDALMLLLISKVIRDEFLEFLFLDKLLRLFGIQSKKNEMTTVRVQSISLNRRVTV